MLGIKHIWNNNKGMTLMELAVGVAVFSIIAVTVAGIFTIVMKQQWDISADQNSLQQSSFVVRLMADELKGATKDAAGNCLGAGFIGKHYILTNFEAGMYKGVKFISSSGECREFYRDNDGAIKKRINGGTPQVIMSNRFSIQYLRFVINGDISSDTSEANKQSKITIALNVKMADGQGKVVQTTASQNNINLP